MKQGKERIGFSIGTLILIVMMLAMGGSPVNVSAEEISETTIVSGIEYTIDEETKTAAVSSYANKTSAEGKEVTIPAQVLYNGNEYRVTKIGNGAFNESAYVEKISVPDTVNVIEAGAFVECSALKDIILPTGLSEIAPSTFLGCSSLESIVIPDTVTRIDNAAFLRCSKLKKITMPDTITYIGSSSFQLCTALEEIALPKELSETGTGLFMNCSSLKRVEIPDGLKEVKNHFFTKCTALEQVVFPASISEFAPDCFEGCENLKTVYYPVDLDLTGYIGIYDNMTLVSYVVNDDGTVSLTVEELKDGVTDIELPTDIAGKKILSVVGPEDVEIEIACSRHSDPVWEKDEESHWYTCSVCRALIKEVHDYGVGTQSCKCDYIPFTIMEQPSGLQLAYDYENASLSVVVKKTLGNESISYQWYENTKEIGGVVSDTYTIPGGKPSGTYKYICKITCGGYLAVTDEVTVTVAVKPDEPSEENVSVPVKGSTYKDDRQMAFYKVTGADIGGKGTVEYIKPVNKKKKVVTIPATVKIGGIAYKVTGIAKNAFKGNRYIKRLIIEKNVEKIGARAFYGCKKLKNITIKTSKLKTKKIGAKAFKNINTKATVKVPKKKVKTYKSMLLKKGLGKKAVIRKV